MQKQHFNVYVESSTGVTAPQLKKLIESRLLSSRTVSVTTTFNNIVTPVPSISYPNRGAYYIKRVTVQFSDIVSKDQVEKIVSYWGSLPYVGSIQRIDWVGANSAVIHVDVSQTRSHDVDGRQILELLGQYLVEGTPTRRTQGYTRAYQGIGQIVRSINGFEY